MAKFLSLVDTWGGSKSQESLIADKKKKKIWDFLSLGVHKKGTLKQNDSENVTLAFGYSSGHSYLQRLSLLFEGYRHLTELSVSPQLIDYNPSAWISHRGSELTSKGILVLFPLGSHSFPASILGIRQPAADSCYETQPILRGLRRDFLSCCVD